MTGNDTICPIWQTKADAKVICMTGSLEDVCLESITVLPNPFNLRELG